MFTRHRGVFSDRDRLSRMKGRLLRFVLREVVRKFSSWHVLMALTAAYAIVRALPSAIMRTDAPVSDWSGSRLLSHRNAPLKKEWGMYYYTVIVRLLILAKRVCVHNWAILYS